MKKLLSTIILAAFTVSSVSAQDNPLKAGSKVKTLTAAEAKALSGNSEPTVNGKPYSQHKAEQDALKKQRESQKPAAIPSGLAITNGPGAAAPAVPQATEPGKAYPGYVAPESKPAVVDSRTVNTKTETRVIADVPLGEGLTLSSSKDGIAQDAVVRKQKELIAPAEVKSNPSQSITDKVPDAYKTPVIKDANKSSGNESIDAKPAVISSSVVSADTKKANPAPDVPSQFRLPATTQSWTGRSTEAKVNNNADPAQSPNAQVVASDINAYKAQQTAGQKASAADVIAKPATVDAAVVTTKEVKTAAAPQVPDQFKLKAETWNDGAVATQASLVKSDPAQSMDAQVASEQYKAPVMDKTNKQSGDEGKNQESKPQVKVDAALVNNAANKQADPTGLALGSNGTAAPASNPQAEVNIKGTSLDPAAKAVAPARSQATGQEGGGNPTPTPANVVKAPVKDASPAATAVNPAGSGPAGNSPAGSTVPVVPVEPSKQVTEKPASKE